MRAHADDDQPFRLFDARRIRLRIAQRRRRRHPAAALISSGVRWSMKTGLPRHATVSRWPTCTGARSTSVVDSAKVSRAGFRLSMNGQIVAATPTAPIAAAVRIRKSRRVSPACAPRDIADCARSAIHTLVISAAAGQAPPRQAILLRRANYATDCRINRQQTGYMRDVRIRRPAYLRNLPGTSRFAPRPVRAGHPAKYRRAAAAGGLLRGRGRSDRAMRLSARRPPAQARRCSIMPRGLEIRRHVSWAAFLAARDPDPGWS